MAGHSVMPGGGWAPTGASSDLAAAVELLDSSRVLAPSGAAFSSNTRAPEVRMPRRVLLVLRPTHAFALPALLLTQPLTPFDCDCDRDCDRDCNCDRDCDCAATATARRLRPRP